MATLTEDQTELLEQLVSYVNDSIQGYDKAAAKAESHSQAVKVALQKNAVDRRFLATGLNERLEHYGESRETSGTLKGAAHRGLIELKDLFGDDLSIDELLAEAIRGEQKLLEHVEKTFDDVAAWDGATVQAISDLKIHLLRSIACLERHKQS